MHTGSSYEPGLSHSATHLPQIIGRGAEPSYDSGRAQQPGQQPQLPQTSPSYFTSNIPYETPPTTSHNNILLAGVQAGYRQDGLSSGPPLTWGAGYEIGGMQTNVYQPSPGGSFPNLHPQPPQHFGVQPSIPPLADSGGGAGYHGRVGRINLLSEGGVAPGGQGYSPQTGVLGPSQHGGQASSDEFNYSSYRHGLTAPAVTNASLQDWRDPALMSSGASRRKDWEHVPRGGGSRQGGGINWAGSGGGSRAGGGGGTNQQGWGGDRGDSDRASAHSGVGGYSGRGGGGRSDSRGTAGVDQTWGSSAGGLGSRRGSGRDTPSGGMPPRPPPPQAPPCGRSQTGSGDEGPDCSQKDFAAEMAALRLDIKTAAEATAAKIKSIEETGNSNLATVKSELETVNSELKSKLETVNSELKSELETVKSDLEAKVFTLESGLTYLQQAVNRGVDPIVIRHLLNEVKIAIHQVTNPSFSPPIVVSVAIHSSAQKALNRGQLEFLTQECLEEVYGNEPDSSRGQGDTAAHSGSTRQDLRNAILRLASKPKYHALRLLYRYKYRNSVGTAAAALLSYSPGERLAANLMLSPAATAAEAVAVKAEAEIFRIHPEWRL